MPDAILLPTIPPNAERSLYVILTLIVLFWIGMIITSFITYSTYAPLYTTVCDSITGVCTDWCSDLRIGSLAHGIICLIALISTALLALLSEMHVPRNALVIISITACAISLLAIFASCAWMFWACIAYFTKTPYTMLNIPCRNIEPHDNLVISLETMVVGFGFFVMLFYFHLRFCTSE